MQFTHKGWFVICPIYIFYPANANPQYVARSLWLEPLFSLCEFVLFIIALFIALTIKVFNYQLEAPLQQVHHVSKLDQPIEIDGLE